MQNNAQKIWEEYRDQELAKIAPVFARLNIELQEEQPHISGERYLMSGKKLVLIATMHEVPVVVKVSTDPQGIAELEREHRVKQALQTLTFAYYVLRAPKELLYQKTPQGVVLVNEYIKQEKNFLERSTEEQFFLTLWALKSLEGVHATTSAHQKIAHSMFGMWSPGSYLKSIAIFREKVTQVHFEVPELDQLLVRASEFMRVHEDTLEQYCGFLTHTDFVPHNLRVKEDEVYLLDHTSLRFGNKHESWARFLNFMLLYNIELHDLLIEYIRENRSPEEYLSLRIMRVHKLSHLLAFYAESLHKTGGDLHRLNLARIRFWSSVLESVLSDKPFDQEAIAQYKTTRDSLRSEDEKRRQKELH